MQQQLNSQAGKFPHSNSDSHFLFNKDEHSRTKSPPYLHRDTSNPFFFLSHKERKPGTKQPSKGEMVRGSSSTGLDQESKAGSFFMATLVMWAVSVLFEIVFNKRTELLLIVAGFCFYQFSNWLIRNYLSRDPLFVNTSVSLLHSFITSVTVALILINQWITNGIKDMFDHSQLVEVIWPGAYAALCISCGYFAYDQWDMLLYRLYSGAIPSILVHHLVLLICFTLALYRKVTINYLVLTLICEMHSVFLHVRKVRRMAGFRDGRSQVVKIEWVLNWFTFVAARFISHVLITVKLIKDASKFGKGVELPLALFGMAGMNLLNAFLGIDLFKAYQRERNIQNNVDRHND